MTAPSLSFLTLAARPGPEPAPPAHPPILLQLVPAGNGGVRDFAELLQRRWAQQGRVSLLETLDLGRSLPGVLMQPGSPSGSRGRIAVLLHYSGYGYQRRGLPTALLRHFATVRAAWGGRLRLVTYFHESFASGPPWRSAFWLSGLQSRLGVQLARMSDAVCTNASPHADWLEDSAGTASGTPLVLPVFAAIGEPEDLMAGTAQARAPLGLVFGAASTRARALRACIGHEELLRRHGIEGLIEVGPSPASTRLPALPCDYRGRLDKPELHALLAQCHAGLIDYPASLLGKSSVFAALAAHGVPVLNTRPVDDDADGLRAGVHHLPLFGAQQAPQPWLSDASTWQAVARAARRWYQPHDSWQQARTLANVLLQGSGSLGKGS